MHALTPLIDRMLAAFCSACFAVPAIVFAGFFWRTVYVAVVGENAAAYRSDTAYDLSVFFLLDGAVFAAASFKFFEIARGRYAGSGRTN